MRGRATDIVHVRRRRLVTHRVPDDPHGVEVLQPPVRRPTHPVSVDDTPWAGDPDPLPGLFHDLSGQRGLRFLPGSTPPPGGPQRPGAFVAAENCTSSTPRGEVTTAYAASRCTRTGSSPGRRIRPASCGTGRRAGGRSDTRTARTWKVRTTPSSAADRDASRRPSATNPLSHNVFAALTPCDRGQGPTEGAPTEGTPATQSGVIPPAQWPGRTRTPRSARRCPSSAPARS